MTSRSSWIRINQKKIVKWVFLLLQEHHARLGLKVYSWAGPEGIGTPRLSFFFDTARTFPPGFEPYGVPAHEALDMSLYQLQVGTFNGTQEHPDQGTRELRTKEILPWIEQQLDVQRHYQAVYEKFNGTFPYETKKPSNEVRAAHYLYSWNVFGLWSSSLDRALDYCTLAMWPDSYATVDWRRHAYKTFCKVLDPWDILVLSTKCESRVFWDLNGLIFKPDGSALDLRQLLHGAVSPLNAVGRVEAFLQNDQFCFHPTV
jgi:hypothetical protein